VVRFPQFEALGPRIAAMSDMSDGDCGFSAPDSSERDQFIRAAGSDPARCVGVRQVHGAAVLAVDASHGGQGALVAADAVGNADGLVTATPGLGLLIGVADCVPVLLYSPQGTAIGALHAGRESTFLNIAAAGVSALTANYNVRPESVHALIGPSVSPAEYEVSEDIAERFRAAGLPVQGRCLDLWGANRQQLIAAGVPAGQIIIDGRCTRSSRIFHSYRRDNNSRRNVILLQM